MDGQILTANEAILRGNKGIYFRGSSKNEGNRKSKAMFGTGNTENQYIIGNRGLNDLFIGRNEEVLPLPLP